MAYRLKLREGARKDLFQAFGWYERQKPGLGTELISEIEAAFALLIKTPEAFPKKKKHLREYNLKIFPYVIIYMIQKNEVIVFAIFHTHLNPNKKPSA